LSRQGYLARGGQIVDASLIPVPIQRNRQAAQELVKNNAMPADWQPAQRRQKDVDASWTQKHGMSHFGYKLSANTDRRYQLIRKVKVSTASVHDTQHVEAVLDPPQHQPQSLRR
jgi:IS5 family transposase